MNAGKLQQVAGGWLVAQGAGHTLLGTPMAHSTLTQEAIWFAAAGLAMVFLGLMNLGPWETLPKWLRRTTIAANASWPALMVGLLGTSQSWRVIAAVASTAGCLVGASIRRRSP